jgi:hypothetical protein
VTVLEMVFIHGTRRNDWHDTYHQSGEECVLEGDEVLSGKKGDFHDAALAFLSTLDPADVYGVVEKKKSFKIYYVRREKS